MMMMIMTIDNNSNNNYNKPNNLAFKDMGQDVLGSLVPVIYNF